MHMRKACFFALSMFVAASASAIPAQPAEVIKTFIQSSALNELLTDQHGYTGIAIDVVRDVSDAVEVLCHQKSRSRSIVSVNLLRGSHTSEFYFQTSHDPAELTRCLPGGPSEL